MEDKGSNLEEQQTETPVWQLGLKTREKLVPVGEEKHGLL